MQVFEMLVGRLGRPLHILDIGGTNAFWKMRGWTNRNDIQIVTINLKAEEQEFSNIEPRQGDATSLPEFADGSFDIVFSNSVIEHLFTFENQRAMAREVQRIGKAYWVQTPNYWFPIEPHFHVPGWQWMPRSTRISLLQRRRCGWRGPCPDAEMAAQLVDEVRLLSKSELQELFPGATLYAERVAGLVKSWVAYDGFPKQSA